MGRRLLILGPPGAGKGTQAETVCKAIGIPHVSTGEMLRDHVSRGTELGTKAKAVMDAGGLVSDEIVIAMVRERLAAPDAVCGFLLDGFPRTRAQAEALDGVLGEASLDAIILLDVHEDELVKRIMLRGRSDDTEEAVRTRLAVYRDQTAPLIDFYQRRGLIARSRWRGDGDRGARPDRRGAGVVITIKTADEFAKMRHAGRVVAEILVTLRDTAAPGVTLLDLDRIAARHHR